MGVLIVLRVCIIVVGMSKRKSDVQATAEQLYKLMNDRKIATRLGEAGIKVSQATICRIRCGKIKKPSYEIGNGLMQLHDRFLKSA